MLNPSTLQRAPRSDATSTSGPQAYPPQWRSGQYSHVSPHLHRLQTAHAPRRTLVCYAQAYGRNQPPEQQPTALVRRPAYQPVQSQKSVYLNLSQVSGKQVITCSRGLNMGTLGEAWVDPQRLEVVSFDVDSKRSAGCIPLMMLKQVGDVVLVQDVDSVPIMDSSAGYIKLLGMEIKTRNGRVVGKVRDFAFNPNNGAITKIEFDDFGLSFLPVNFFDLTSIASDFIESVAYGCVTVTTDEYAKRERPGILSNVVRNLGKRSVAGLLSDGSRSSEAAGLLPDGYNYQKWLSDIARWEQETGMRYEDYVAAQQQQQQQYGAPRGALPPGRQQPQQQQQQQAGPSGAAATRYALPPAAAGRPGPRPAQQQQQQPGAAPGQGQGAYGYGYPGQPAPQYGSQYGGAGGDPRYRGAAGAGGTAGPAPARYPQWGQQPSAQPAAPAPQQWGQQAPPLRQPAAAPAGPRGPGPAPAPAPGLPGPSQPMQASQAPQPLPQQQQVPQPGAYQGQYTWPGPGAAAGPGPGSGQGPAAAGGGPDGAGPAIGPAQGGAGGALRVDEWLAREGQGLAPEPALEAAGRQQAPPPQQQQQGGAAPSGWEGQGGAGGRPPY